MTTSRPYSHSGEKGMLDPTKFELKPIYINGVFDHYGLVPKVAKSVEIEPKEPAKSVRRSIELNLRQSGATFKHSADRANLVTRVVYIFEAYANKQIETVLDRLSDHHWGDNDLNALIGPLVDEFVEEERRKLNPSNSRELKEGANGWH